MRRKMKHLVKLITLEDTKEKELLKSLLLEANIIFYAVEREVSGGRAEQTTEDIYVNENRLEDALITVDRFQCDLNHIREFLEERKIQSCIEADRYYEAGLKTASNGSMCGSWVFKEHVYVDEIHLDEAIKAAEVFFEEEKLQKERGKMSEGTDGEYEEDGEDGGYGEDGEYGKDELGKGSEITEYADCEYLPDRFFNWVRGIPDRKK